MAFENLKGKMNIAIFALCMFITFMFLVTSAPIAQFKGKGINKSGASVANCVTVWGLKHDCYKNEYDMRPNDMTCSKPKQLFQTCEAFYIVSVVVSLACCLFSGLCFVGKPLKPLLIVLGILNIAFSVIPWAVMTAVWYQNFCGNVGFLLNNESGQPNMIPTGEPLRDNYKTSAGYGLTIAGWCVNIIGVIALFAVSI